ncbi:NETI motif-containing protein [Neobacillus piezotolerans]|uniref:NETI motif-containing protein n=1 Tax=Neobacillus piezotolerans TaxID=2259171 RepID=A0A3D8GQP3_9BACI|nr:NETI motif-containing protein [Neobacillus piezotolerans]RDU36601.1 NETI motif-containing protein [Neobacillus piezotolerans]
MGKKQLFEVKASETIDECLKRMDEQGYTPIRRLEKPIFKEEGDSVVPAGRQIIFEGKLKEE